jgi:hypothetical protein
MSESGGEMSETPTDQEVADLRATLNGLRKLLEQRSKADDALHQAIEETLLMAGRDEHRSRLAERNSVLGRVQLLEDIESLGELRQVLQEDVQREMEQLQAHLEEVRNGLSAIGGVQHQLQENLEGTGRLVTNLENRLARVSHTLESIRAPLPAEPVIPIGEVEGGLEVAAEAPAEVETAPSPPTEQVKEVETAPAPPPPEEEPARVPLGEIRSTWLVARGFRDISVLRPFERALRALPGVIEVEPRRYSGGTLEMLVVHQGDLRMEPDRLSGFGLRLVRSFEDRVEFEMGSASGPE